MLLAMWKNKMRPIMSFVIAFFFAQTCISEAGALDAKSLSLVKQADDCKQQGQIDAAIDLYAKAFSTCSSFEQTKCDAADILRTEAECFAQKSNLNQACELLKRVAFIYELNERPNIDAMRKANLPYYYKEDYYSPTCATVLTRYADILSKLNKQSEASTVSALAQKLQRQSIDEPDVVADWKKKFFEAVPNTTTTAWSDKADEKFKVLVELAKKFDPASARLTTTWWAFSNWYVSREKFKEAQAASANALSVAERTFGANSPALCDLLCYHANVCRRAKDFAKSEEFYKRALAIYSSQLPDTNSNVVGVLASLQDLYRDQGLAQGQKALEVRQRLSPDAAKSQIDTRRGAEQNRDMLSLYVANGKYEQAEATLSKVMEFDRAANGKNSLADILALAEVKTKVKKYSEAEQLYLSARQRCISERSNQYDVVLEKYAALLRECAREEEAEHLEAEARQFRLDGKKKLFH